MKDKTIHHPHASWATDEHHSMFGLPDWSLLGGFSSSSNIMLKREGDSDENGVSHHGNQLLVCIHNKVGSPLADCIIRSGYAIMAVLLSPGDSYLPVYCLPACMAWNFLSCNICTCSCI